MLSHMIRTAHGFESPSMFLLTRLMSDFDKDVYNFKMYRKFDGLLESSEILSDFTWLISERKLENNFSLYFFLT